MRNGNQVAQYEIGLPLGVTGELSKLQDTLSTVNAVLVDADGLQEPTDQQSVWLGKLKDVCYAIDDILDEFEVIDLQQQVNQRTERSRSIPRKVLHCFSWLNLLVFRFTMGHKIKKIREKLDQIAADRNNFHLPHVERSLPPHRPIETHSFVIPSNVIGRVHDRDLLVEKLVQVADGEGVAVISIVGIGGLGKTTLAKLVYEDERVGECFDFRKWVCVSDQLYVNNIIGNIVDNNSLTLEQLQQHLRRTLSDSRYLLILDDVWNEDLQKWIELRNLLLCGKPGSKIVVTTRSQLVVNTLDPIYVHKLAGLSDEESSFLLMEWALGKGRMEQFQNLKTIGEQIVRICKGDVYEYENKDCRFTMHDLMHDLALSVIGSESLVLTKDSPRVPNQKVQHVYFSNGDLLRNGFPSSVLQLRKLRTIIVEENIHWSQLCFVTCIVRFKCLRILYLRKYYFKTLPRSIGGLKHLKYLDLSSNYNLKSLPRSLCKLQSLQTLILKRCLNLEELPRDFGDLISLRYLSLSTQERFLPENVFQRLACLRTLEILGCENLECLFQTKGNKTQGIPCGLRKLVIEECHNLGSLPGLPYLTRLEYLVLDCRKLDLNMDEESIRGGLTSLRQLKISSLHNSVTLPQWLVPSAAKTLTHLFLYDVRFQVPTTLPEDLNALQELSIYECPKLMSVPGGLHALQRISINYCPQLMSMPGGLYSLQSIYIFACPQLEERCQRETGEDWHKIAHVPDISLGSGIPILGDPM
ncbi:hypothetical protein RJ640_001096 [Escallonia rubra]|uniref:Disease resistance protein RGA3 n=1 Tax=Escallonia rubra TaxID=112253 RepID=A0AA88UTG3_9ASTE|nr:hypothetical protein RJ640_001096 [Escallonia rubra]